MPKKQTAKNGRHPSAGQFAKFADAPFGPLSVDERSKLFDLIEEASASNHDLLDAGRGVDEARENLSQAAKRLKEAEERMVKARQENSSIHALMDPLLRRLPTV